MTAYYVNIGLNVNGVDMGEPQERAAIERLQEFERYDYVIKTSSYYADGVNVRERTLVAVIYTNFDVTDVRDWAERTSVALRQDCVALSFDNGGRGVLCGPSAHAYGEFSGEYFIPWRS